MIGLASVRADAAYLSGRSYASGGYREFKKTLDTSQQARIQSFVPQDEIEAHKDSRV